MFSANTLPLTLLLKSRLKNECRPNEPLIQKYAPAAAGLLGNYKDEILGAAWLGSFIFSSVKQIKQLKERDAQAKKETEQVEQNEVASDVDAAH